MVTTVDTMFMNFMKLYNGGKYTNQSKRVSKFERKVQRMSSRKNPETKTNRGNKRK